MAYKTAPPKPDFCECCHTADRKLVLDHDHITGQFRGWICGNCNKGIGNLGDNVNGLEMAIKYLNGETKSSNPLMEMLVIT